MKATLLAVSLLLTSTHCQFQPEGSPYTLQPNQVDTPNNLEPIAIESQSAFTEGHLSREEVQRPEPLPQEPVEQRPSVKAKESRQPREPRREPIIYSTKQGQSISEESSQSAESADLEESNSASRSPQPMNQQQNRPINGGWAPDGIDNREEPQKNGRPDSQEASQQQQHPRNPEAASNINNRPAMLEQGLDHERTKSKGPQQKPQRPQRPQKQNQGDIAQQEEQQPQRTSNDPQRERLSSEKRSEGPQREHQREMPASQLAQRRQDERQKRVHKQDRPPHRPERPQKNIEQKPASPSSTDGVPPPPPPPPASSGKLAKLEKAIEQIQEVAVEAVKEVEQKVEEELSGGN